LKKTPGPTKKNPASASSKLDKVYLEALAQVSMKNPASGSSGLGNGYPEALPEVSWSHQEESRLCQLWVWERTPGITYRSLLEPA